MADWRFIAFDLRTGARLTDLAVQSWQSADVLNDPGSWSAVVELDGAAATSTTARRNTVADATRRGRSLIVAERDGIPVYSGIVWRRRYDANAKTLQLAGAGLLSYFNRFSQRDAITYTATDQCSIFADLIARVQAKTGCDIGITTPTVTTGVLRDRVYEAFSGKYFGELLQALAAVQNGFDHDIRVEYSAGAPVRYCRMWYPRRGRTLEATGLRFRAPGNGLLFSVDEDGTDMAVSVVALGAGDGKDMLVTTASRPDLVDAGWPAYETTRAWKDVTNIATLSEHAQAAVERLCGIDRETIGLTVDPSFPGQPWGSWDLGDDCLVIVDDDPFYPANDDGSPGLATQRRVVGHSWTVTRSSEQLTVTVEPKVIP